MWEIYLCGNRQITIVCGLNELRFVLDELKEKYCRVVEITSLDKPNEKHYIRDNKGVVQLVEQ